MKKQERSDPLNGKMAIGSIYYGFVLIRKTELPQLNAWFYELKHKETGAKYIHISQQNPENTFYIMFKTPPQDSTGITHVLEHMTLCGSKKYPVKNSLFSMEKRSLASYINAHTFRDRTAYPFSTVNKKDFYNLMDVYLDAVFNPRLLEIHFAQEGHRLEFKGNELKRTGVVYNEMKSIFSDEKDYVFKEILKALYPDSIYSLLSGGDPKKIPNLNYKDLREFYEKYYHPNNAYFFSYGNFSFLNHLKKVNSQISGHHTPKNIETHVKGQKRWQKPKNIQSYYPTDNNSEKKHYLQIGWLNCSIKDTFEVLILDLISKILMNDDYHPLNKALIESKIGNSLGICGFVPFFKDVSLVCGLKETRKEDAQKFKKLVFETLSNLTKKGIPKELTEAIIHEMKFHTRKIINNNGIKLGKSLMLEWIHGGDPLEAINILPLLENIEKKIEKEPFFLEKKIKEHLLDNPHHALIIISPDSEILKNFEKQNKQELADKIKNLSEQEKLSIQKQNEKLYEMQKYREDISCLPKLERKDLDSDVNWIKAQEVNEHLKFYPIETPGTEYFYSIIKLNNLPKKLIEYVPLFNLLFTEIGTKKRNFEQVLMDISRYTGGMGLIKNAGNNYIYPHNCTPFLLFKAECLNENREKMYQIIKELWLEADFSNLERIKFILNSYKSALENSITDKGHLLTRNAAARNLYTSSYIQYLWSNINQIKLIRKIKANEDWEKLSQNLQDIKNRIFLQSNIKCAIANKNLSQPKNFLNFFQELPIKTAKEKTPSLQLKQGVICEGYQINSAISFVSKCIKAPPLKHKHSAAISIACRIIEKDFLHEEIREKGGAYGVFVSYRAQNGIISLASYRDPEIERTLRKYDEICNLTKTRQVTLKKIEESIIQIFTSIDDPLTPQSQALNCFVSEYTGQTRNLMRSFKKKLLEVKEEDVLGALEKHFTCKKIKEGNIAVISSREKIIEENKKLEQKLKLKKI